MTKIDTSDGATGLPPMQLLGPGSEFIVLAGASGGQGILTIPGTDEHVAVRFIQLRGLLLPKDGDDPDADPVWIQRSAAVPVELIPAVIAALKSA